MDKTELAEFNRQRKIDLKDKTKTRCLVIRNRQNGGIQDEFIEKAKLPAGYVDRLIFGVKMPWLVPEGEGYNEFVLPNEVEITPEKVARIPGCEPWQRYKTIERTIWDNLKPMVPVAVIIIDIIAMVMIRG